MYSILICDDERDIVSALKIYLEAEGYRTVCAYSGAQALKALENEEIHLVLMDIMRKARTRTRYWDSTSARTTM